jgi:hypothetical protein
MPNPLWPASLPQTPYSPDDEAPQYAPVDNATRTTVDAGPVKQRRRYTAVAEPVTVQIKLSSAQLITLIAFKATTLQEVNPFDWIDFVSGAAATYHFIGPIGQRYYGGDFWTVTIPLEKLP